MDVAIIGVGISGILTALNLIKNRKVSTITIFERRPQNLIPRKHCSGIISSATLSSIPHSSRFVENTYSYVDIIVGKHFETELVFDKGAIHKIDRTAHERYLIDVVKDRGVDIKFCTDVVDIGIEHRGYKIKTTDRVEGTYNRVVVSEGYPPRLSQRLGLKAYSEPFSGVQQDLYLEKRLRAEHLDRLTVYIRIGGEFAWFIPVNERRAVVGIASRSYSLQKLELYRKFFVKKLGVEVARAKDTYGGIVLRGYPLEIVKGGILGIGDAISSVKSLSGGGLYPISVISLIYGEDIHQVHLIRRRLRAIMSELRKQFMLYSIIKRFYDRIPQVIPLRRVSIEVKNAYFYDHHEKLLAKAFTSIMTN